MSKLKNLQGTTHLAPLSGPFSRRNFMKVAGVGAGAVALGQAPWIRTTLAQTACTVTTWPLTAGQTIDVGSVSVWSDAEKIYVNYTLDYQNPACPDGPVDAEFGTLHVWIGNDLLNLPLPNGGPPCNEPRPNPGGFCNAATGQCFDATGLTTYTFEYVIEDLVLAGYTFCDTQLFVVTHAEVTLLDCDGNAVAAETAFGGETPGDCNAWWFYDDFTPSCDDCGVGTAPICETSYAYGTHVWTTQKRSNPEKLPSLELTRNRWGWAIHLEETGVSTWDIWEGAGLNHTDKGLMVGTLTVDWDGTNVEVCYDTSGSDRTIGEVHIYAGDDEPNTIAPGQYGFIDSFDPGVSNYCASLPLADSTGGGVWIVAHAVTCHEE